MAREADLETFAATWSASGSHSRRAAARPATTTRSATGGTRGRTGSGHPFATGPHPGSA
ncbi:hypothetical protein I3F58_08800 [Streptomyces sp. MUM 203J]|nr:hypothetical protein [Streptomyces sp. MUM 203J]